VSKKLDSQDYSVPKIIFPVILLLMGKRQQEIKLDYPPKRQFDEFIIPELSGGGIGKNRS